MEVIQEPYNHSFYYGIGGASLDGLKLNVVLETGEQLEVSAWDENWYGLGILSFERTSTGDYIERVDNGVVRQIR